MSMGASVDIALMFGVAAGFLCSPALMFALWHGPWLLGLVCIAAPTATAAYIAGQLTPTNGGPFLSMEVSLGVFLIASMARGIIGMKCHRPAPPGSCSQCHYDHSGLAPGTKCPECGSTTIAA
ncbi:MAG: hypothetical protein K8R92_01760 [Planctomycetes bacterium]|nr:hypothetical protein [Planctomycetota bacterium]